MIIQEKIKPNFNILQINCGQNIPTWENVAIGNSQLWCHRACVSPLQRTQFWETAHIFVVDIVENIHQNVSVHVTTWSGSPGKSNCTFISVPIVCCLFGCWLHHRFGARPVWPLLGFFHKILASWFSIIIAFPKPCEFWAFFIGSPWHLWKWGVVTLGTAMPLMQCPFYQYTGAHFADLGRLSQPAALFGLRCVSQDWSIKSPFFLL